MIQYKELPRERRSQQESYNLGVSIENYAALANGDKICLDEVVVGVVVVAPRLWWLWCGSSWS